MIIRLNQTLAPIGLAWLESTIFDRLVKPSQTNTSGLPRSGLNSVNHNLIIKKQWVLFFILSIFNYFKPIFEVRESEGASDASDCDEYGSTDLLSFPKLILRRSFSDQTLDNTPGEIIIFVIKAAFFNLFIINFLLSAKTVFEVFVQQVIPAHIESLF